jgi:hypothetical protein
MDDGSFLVCAQLPKVDAITASHPCQAFLLHVNPSPFIKTLDIDMKKVCFSVFI